MSYSEKIWRPGDVRDDENVTRFTGKKRYAAPPDKVDISLFLPSMNEENNQYELSVYRVDGLEDFEIFDLGREHVNRQTCARADIEVSSVRGIRVDGQIVGLDLVADGVPHERHANVINWPNGRGDEDIALRNEIANRLRKVAKPVRRKKKPQP